MTNEEIALEIIKNIPWPVSENKTIGELRSIKNLNTGEIVAFDVDTSFKIIERALKEYRIYKRAFELTIEETASEMDEDEKEFEEKMLERARNYGTDKTKSSNETK